MENNRLKSYKDLTVWRKAMDLVILVYKLTETFPKYEQYGLTSQMCRCAISIPSNIAEGSRRRSRKGYILFVDIAYGSGAELETQIEISKRLGYLEDSLEEEIGKLLDEVMKMLNGLASSLRTTN